MARDGIRGGGWPRRLAVCVGWALAAWLGEWSGHHAAADEPPNIVLILADDLAFDAVGFHGNELVRTPHIDRLAREGVRFDRAYNMGGWNGAVCLASRAMLNTGQFLWHAQAETVRLKTDWVPNDRLWSQRLARAGYRTWMTGKWHVAVEPERVFHTVRHVRPGMPEQVDAGYHRPRNPEDRAWQPWDRTHGGYWKGGRHWSEIVADDAIEFLSQALETPEPFFMYLAFNAPHDPRQSPREFVQRYSPDQIPLPRPFLQEYPWDIGSNRIRDEQLAPFPRTPYSIRVNRLEYYALIDHLDVQIGRILNAIDQLPAARRRRTYVIFTSDHGLACGHHGLMGKQNMFEPSMRVPLVMRGPGIEPGQRITAAVYMQDIVPTLLEAAGAGIDGIEFRSLWPLITGGHERSYGAIYGAYVGFQRMVIEDNLKLIVYPRISRHLLFDLAADPWEEHDLADQPEWKPQIERLQRFQPTLQASMDDPRVTSPEGP